MMEQQSGISSMGKVWIEVCLMSARGLPRSSLWKYQWYAVGWIDPKDKYCTKIDSSGNPNPVWKTKFTTVVDTSESDFQDMVLHVEVYSRDHLFLREKLQGSATVSLKEFLAKHCKKAEGSKEGIEDVGSFQLRKKNSNKPQGFIDVSIRISEEKEGTSSYFFLGNEDGFNLRNSNNVNGITMSTSGGPLQGHQMGHAELPFHPPGNLKPTISAQDYPYPMSYPNNPATYSNPSVGGPSYPSQNGPNYRASSSNPSDGRPSYPPANHRGYPPPPPPPPPPSHAGYAPSFFPQSNDPSTSYYNMPSSGAGRGVGPGFGVGLGAGAVAAGAVMFGSDYMSGFELPPAGMRDASLTISTDPFF